MGPKKSISQSLKVVAVTQVSIVVISQVAMILLARILAPDDFGVYAIALVFVNLSISVTTFGLDFAMIHRQKDVETAFETAATLRLLFATIGAVLVFLLSTTIADFFGMPILVNVLRFTSVLYIVLATGFESATRLAKQLSFGLLSLTKVAKSVIWSVAAVLLALIGLGYWSLLLAYFAGAIGTAAILWIILPWKLRHHIDFRLARELLRFGVFPLGTAILTFLAYNLDRVVVARILGDASVGIYWIAFSYGTIIPNILTNAVTTVMFPTFAQHQNDLERLKRRYFASLRYVGWIAIPLGVGIAAVSSNFIHLFLGDRWADAIMPLALLSILGSLQAITGPALSVFLATGRPNLMLRQATGVAIPFFILLIPAVVYGKLIGISLLFVGIGFVSFVWVTIMVAGVLKCSPSRGLREIAPPIGASISMMIICLAIGAFLGISPISFASQIVGGLATYVLFMNLITKGTFVSEARRIIRTAF